MEETFLDLVRSKGHWEFEIFLIFIFDVLIGVLIWPQLQKWWRHHKADDNKIEKLEKRVRELESRVG